MSKENRNDEGIVLSPSKIYRLIKTIDSYRKELKKSLDVKHIKSSTKKNKVCAITKLNTRTEMLNIVLEDRGIDDLLDSYIKRLTSLAIDNANKTTKVKLK